MAFSAIQVSKCSESGRAVRVSEPCRSFEFDRHARGSAERVWHSVCITLVSLTATRGYAFNCAGTGTSTSCTNNSISSPACPGSYIKVTVTVQTQVTYTPPIHIPGLPNSIQLQGTAKQKVLQ